MKHRIVSAIALTASLLLSSCATKMSSDPNAPAGPPDATLTMTQFQASYYGSASTGRGTIQYQGGSRDFSITGVGAGGTGAQSIDAVGEVYNLDSLSEFPGTYTGARSGLTLFKGKFHERYSNGKTVIYVTGKTSGLSSSTGIDKIIITLD